MIRIFSPPAQLALSVFFLTIFIASNSANAIENPFSAEGSIANITELNCEFDHSKTRYSKPIREGASEADEEYRNGFLTNTKKGLLGYQVMSTILWTRVAHTFFYINECGPSFSANSDCRSLFSEENDWEQTKALNLITGDSGDRLYAEESVLIKYNPHPSFLYYRYSDFDSEQLPYFRKMENMISRKNGSFKMYLYRDFRYPDGWNETDLIILEGTCSIDESKRLF